MAYDEKLADRMRKILKNYRGVSERKMFGGLAFMLRGKMFCGIIKEDLVVRVGKERNEEALSKPHARPMDFTGKPMAGFVFVNSKGTKTDKSLENWIKMGIEFVKKG